MPIVGQIGAEQNDVASLDRLDPVPDEAGPGSRFEEQQFTGLVIMPVFALAADPQLFVGRQDHIHVAEILAPTQQAEGVPGGDLDFFLDDGHG